VEIIPDALRLGALEDEVLQQAVEGVGHALGLVLARLSAEGLEHRAGLIDQEEEAGGVGAADLGAVRHGLARWAPAGARGRGGSGSRRIVPGGRGGWQTPARSSSPMPLFPEYGLWHPDHRLIGAWPNRAEPPGNPPTLCSGQPGAGAA